MSERMRGVGVVAIVVLMTVAIGVVGLFRPGMTTGQTGEVASPVASPMVTPMASPVVSPLATPLTTAGGVGGITEERVSALETRVAVVEERLDELAAGGGTIAATPPPEASGEGGPLVISGTGSIVTEVFPLEAGRYQVTVDLASESGILLTLYGPSGSEDLLFSEITLTGGTATVIYQATEPGMYFLESGGTSSAWTVTFEKR